MKRVSPAKTPSFVWRLISPAELVTMKVRPWLIMMPGGATLTSIGIGFSFFLSPEPAERGSLPFGQRKSDNYPDGQAAPNRLPTRIIVVKATNFMLGFTRRPS